MNGTLALGTNAQIALNSGTHTLAAITGTGTITVSPGATLTLTGAIANTGVNITLAGGTLNTGSFTHSLGALRVTDDSTIDFGSSGNSRLTVSSLDVTAGKLLSASNWQAGARRFFAAAVTGSPARDTINLTPLNQVALAGNSPAVTLWARGTPGELLVAALTYLDTVANNDAVDGGTGTWDG
ncbi:hypothetical protein WDZ92_52605, partial [Nostoc sp. NIES-2111]